MYQHHRQNSVRETFLCVWLYLYKNASLSVTFKKTICDKSIFTFTAGKKEETSCISPGSVTVEFNNRSNQTGTSVLKTAPEAAGQGRVYQTCPAQWYWQHGTLIF